jgi:3-deoxy-D-manno-octulosonate 8-phosphate phosphatase (KDO 8-P phosphatase)
MGSILDKARAIKLLVLDVDGVMTDGSVYFTSDGDEFKAFNIMDGLGIKLLQRTGVQVAIITGRTSALVQRRAKDLGIEELQQGREDKLVALLELSERAQIPLKHIAYMGDDLPDLAAIQRARLGITVPASIDFIKRHADFITSCQGGKGAVREVCNLIMTAQGSLNDILESYQAPSSDD